MVRGREETSTSGRPRGRPRAKPSASNVIASLMMEELKVYCEVPNNIDLRFMERADDSTPGGEHNGVFFTHEHLAAGLRFPIPAMSRPDSRSDSIGESEPVSGCETIYWDSLLFFFF